MDIIKMERELNEDRFMVNILELDPTTILYPIRAIQGIEGVIVDTNQHNALMLYIRTINGALYTPMLSLRLCKIVPEKMIDFIKRNVDEINTKENPYKKHS